VGAGRDRNPILQAYFFQPDMARCRAGLARLEPTKLPNTAFRCGTALRQMLSSEDGRAAQTRPTCLPTFEKQCLGFFRCGSVCRRLSLPQTMCPSSPGPESDQYALSARAFMRLNKALDPGKLKDALRVLIRTGEFRKLGERTRKSQVSSLGTLIGPLTY
jgi:hypothetical protein